MRKLFFRVLFNSSVLCAFTYHAQTITTIAGVGTATFSGDGGLATIAAINNPQCVALAANGDLYIADSGNNRVRKINSSGVITTVAGNGTGGFSGDGGLATNAQLNYPAGICFDVSGNLYIADLSNHRIRKVNTSGTITTVAGTGAGGYSGDGGNATSAMINLPIRVAVDNIGNIYIVDLGNNRIRKVNGAGIISTFAGNGGTGFSGDGGLAINAQMNTPTGVAVDAIGNVYLSDKQNQRIRKVTSGTITTIAGTGVQGSAGDGGLATSAQLSFPESINIDNLNNLYVSGTDDRVRKINAGGIITTYAGNGTTGWSGDGGLATSAQINYPHGVAVNQNGVMFIADYSNNRIRKVTCVSPTISVSSGSICVGSTYTITANGASSYTYQGGSSVVSPTSTTSFSVVGTGTNGCVTPTAAISNVTVNALPSLTTVTSSSIICGPPFQQTATLTANGANTYTWNPGGAGTNIAVSPSVTTTYTVTGTDVNGCTNTSIITQSVSTCASISELPTPNSELFIFPNPFNDKINIITSNTAESPIQIFNALGSLIYSDVIKDKTEIDLGDQAAGIYIVRIGSLNKKIIKE